MPGEVSATWKFLVDFDRDGDFSTSGDNISAYVMGGGWFLGAKKPYQDVGDEITCELTLRNNDKRFSPEYSSGPYYGKLLPQRQLKIQSVYGGGTVTHFQGWIEEIAPVPGKDALTATLRAIGSKGLMEDAEVFLPLMTDATADEVLERIFQGVSIPPSDLTGSWVLGVPGYSEIGETTYLADVTAAYNFETGLRVLPFVADTWDDGIKAMKAIKDVVAAERGRFFFDRDGRATFWNRQHLELINTVAATFNNTMSDMSYVFGQDIANIVQVDVQPRTVSANNTDILWRLDEAITLQPNEERVIRARFADPATGAKVAAITVNRPTKEAGTFVTDRIWRCKIEKFEWDARSATITVKNNNQHFEATVSTLIVTGKKLTTFKKETLEARDETSISLYGAHVLKVESGLMSDRDDANNIAYYELARRKDPRGAMNWIQVDNRSAALLTQQINRRIGDRISVQEPQTGHSADYFIIGEAHTLTSALHHHETIWYLEPAEANQFWLLGEVGFSELGVTTYLGL